MSKKIIPIIIILLAFTLIIFFNNSFNKLNKNQDKKNQNTDLPNIIVNTPSESDIVGQSIYLSGKARTFENTFTFRLKNLRTNTIYAESSTVTDAKDAGEYGNFNFNIDFSGNSVDIKDNDSLLLEVFQYSPKDGTETDKKSINLNYKNLPKKAVKLFFINPKLSQNYNCEQSFPVIRNIDQKTDLPKTLLQTLIIGPTDKEMAKGYNTYLNPQTIIKNYSLDKEIVTIDISNSSNITDICKIKSIKSQITQTLKQFPEIKQVILTIDNQPI